MNVPEKEAYLDASSFDDDDHHNNGNNVSAMPNMLNRVFTNDLLHLYSVRIFKKREPKSLNQLLLTYQRRLLTER